jgi:hypothetical protein
MPLINKKMKGALIIMQGTMKFTFLGIDEFIGKKDPSKKFYQVSLLQDNEVIKVFLSDGQEVLFANFDKFDELIAVVSFKLGQDKYGMKIDYRIISVETINIPFIPDEEEKVSDIKKSKTV